MQRYIHYDYSRGAVLFVSLSTKPRRWLFGKVPNGKMELSELGSKVASSLWDVFHTTEGIDLMHYTVLPDHCHFRILLHKGFDNATAIKLLNRTVGRFKSYTTKLFHDATGQSGPLWQASFHDLICMSEAMIRAVDRYIEYNAYKYFVRHRMRDALKLHEPLYSPRLSPDEFWRGVGEVGFLNDDRPMLAFRGGHKMNPSLFQKVVEAFRRIAATKTIICGFISPVEREVYNALSTMPGAQLIKVLPYAMPHDYTPPASLMPAIAAKRLAIIARGNSEAEFSRSACLELNEAIVPIAKYNGQAIWWRSDGTYSVR